MLRRKGVTAIGLSDLLHAKLARYQRLVAEALDAVLLASARGRVAISYSGGKDSTVVLDLVRRVIPDAPAAWFDSGCEWTGTAEIAAHYHAERVAPVMDFPSMCRYAGWWGYRHPVDPGSTFDVGETLIFEPSFRFATAHGISVYALGLRAEEGTGRRWNAKRGALYYSAQDERWHLCPLAQWTTDDVWAYIAERQLQYHPAYDAMTQLGIPRPRQRIDFLLNENQKAPTVSWAPLVKYIDMDLFNRLAAEFPVWAAYA